MKIEINHDIQNANNNTIRSPNKKQDAESFDAILKNRIQISDRRADVMQCPTQPLVGPASLETLPPISNSVELEAVQRLLDKMDAYQQLLADSRASLRTVQPALGQMEQQAENSKALVEQLPGNHPLRMIFEESLQYVHQEMQRFNAGYYVDD